MDAVSIIGGAKTFHHDIIAGHVNVLAIEDSGDVILIHVRRFDRAMIDDGRPIPRELKITLDDNLSITGMESYFS